MDSFLKANLTALGTGYPEILERFAASSNEDPDQDQDPVQEVRVEQTKSQWPTLYIRTHQDEGVLYSRYQPLVEAERWANQLHDRQTEGIVLFGLGLGYPLQALRRAFGPDLPILVYEPSWKIFEQAVRAVDLAEAFTDPKTVIVVADQAAFYKEAEVLLHLNKFDVKWYEWPAYHRLMLQFGAPMRDEFLRLGRQVEIIQNTIVHFHKLWPQNCLKNLNVMLKSPGIAQWVGRFPNRPAVIVCAGPSLQQNLELLRQVKGKAVIICVDTAYRVLVEHDIEPDLICSIDGTEANYKHFRNLTSTGVPLLYKPSVHHKIIEEFGQKPFVTNVNSIMNDLVEGMENKGEVDLGGSVSTVAFQTARVFRCDPIVFIGQDLAYTGGKTYTQGVHDPGSEKERRESITMPQIEVEANDGGKVWTYEGYDVIRRWFEEKMEQIREQQETPPRVINATGGGAKIAGMEVLPFAEVVERFCQETFEIKSVLEAHEPTKQEDYDYMNSRLREVLRHLAQLKRLARIALQTVYRMTDLLAGRDGNQQDLKECVAVLERIDAHMRSTRAIRWLDMMMIQKYVDVSFDHYEHQALMLTDFVEATRLAQNYAYLYQGYLDTIDELRSMVAEAYSNLQTEIVPTIQGRVKDEHSANPSDAPH